MRKSRFNVLGTLMIVSLMFMVSCSKDTDPSETDLFVGTYHGEISYSDGEETIIDEDGRVTVAKVGDTYTFAFGTGIPNITGVKFERSDDNTYISIGDGLTGITISESNLNMFVTNNEGTWTADCER